MFMWGPAPIRRTIDYLRSGKFIVKDNIKIMELHYCLRGKNYIGREAMKADHHHGLRELYFWEMPRIQYQNPRLQIVRMLDKMPSPFIRFWMDDGNELIIDCFAQSHRQILERVIKTAGKSERRLQVEASLVKESTGKQNPALFGHGRERYCACEVPGQHPCPGVIRVPRFDQLEVDIGGSSSRDLK